jgi:hypothetical protein
LSFGGLNGLLNLVDRKTGDIAAVVAAYLGKQRKFAATSAARRRCRVTGEIAITVGREDSRVDIRITVVPKSRIALDGVVIDVIIGERPEHRPNISIPAAAMLPPPVRTVPAMPTNPAAAAVICPRVPGLLSKRALRKPPGGDKEFMARRMLPGGRCWMWLKSLPPCPAIA